MGESFIYLEKNFSFDMNNADVKAEFVTDMNKYFDILNRLLLHQKHKLLSQSIFIVNLDGNFLSITLQVPGSYII